MNPDWIEIPRGTLDDLRRKAVGRYDRRDGRLAPMEGFPIHHENGKWYVEIGPRQHGSNDFQRLIIEEVIELLGPGTWTAYGERIHVWDGEEWLDVPRILVSALGVLGLGNKLTPEELGAVKSYLAETEAEAERLALRQLLAEAQAGGEDDGSD